jgi:DGQHR domain-containing protein
MSLILRALPFNQKRIKMYLATVQVGLLDHFSIALWNPQSPMGRRGYQRRLDTDRVSKIARYFERRDSIMPVAGLLNVRQKGVLKYRNGKLTVPDGEPIWVVDMQHRMKGLIQARDDKLIPSTFQFPVVLTEGLSHIEEAAQFYIINTKAKKMDVALTRRLLIENNRVKDVADVRPWEIAAVKITIALNRELPDNPWFGTIRQPNEERLQSHIATEKSFVNSLRQLLIGKRVGHPRRIAKRLAKYWSAVRTNVEEPFKDPKRYLIQKTPGMFAFNFFLAPAFFAKHREKKYLKALSGLKRLGPQFWRRLNKRGARRFGTGMAGYANLAMHVKKFL